MIRFFIKRSKKKTNTHLNDSKELNKITDNWLNIVQNKFPNNLNIEKRRNTL